MSAAVGDEGGFAPDVQGAKEALAMMAEAVKRAGYTLGKDICFAIDVAASELYEEDKKAYYFPGDTFIDWHRSLSHSRRDDRLLRRTDRDISRFIH